MENEAVIRELGEVEGQIATMQENASKACERLTALEHTISGVDGTEGLKADVKKLKEEIEGYKNLKAKAIGAFIVVQAMMGVIIWLVSLLR